MVFLREFGDAASDTAGTLADTALCDDAYARGLAQGQAQAEAAIEARIAVAVATLTASLSDVQAIREDARTRAAADASAALAAVVRVLCPGLAAAGLAEQAATLLATRLCDVPQPVSVRAAPAIAARIADGGAAAEVSADADLPETRIEIVWPDGGATLDTGDVARRILALADELEAPAEPTEEQSP